MACCHEEELSLSVSLSRFVECCEVIALRRMFAATHRRRLEFMRKEMFCGVAVSTVPFPISSGFPEKQLESTRTSHCTSENGSGNIPSTVLVILVPAQGDFE